MNDKHYTEEKHYIIESPALSLEHIYPLITGYVKYKTFMDACAAIGDKLGQGSLVNDAVFKVTKTTISVNNKYYTVSTTIEGPL